MPEALSAAGAALRRRRAAARWRRFTSRPAALVLMYHRVADLPRDPNGIAVRPDRFEGHLRVLRRNYEPLPLRTLTRGLREGRLPRGGVVITFDDGYEDNLTHASPLLARFAVPATVFVATGQVGAEREFWWDELERILLASPRIPPELAVEVAGGVRRFAFGGDASWTEAELDRHRDWTLSSPTDPTERHRAFRVLSDRLRASPPDEIERVVAGLAEWAGTDRTPRPSHATLDEEGLRDLADRDGIEIGAHTISHPKLPVLEPEARWREIEGSRAWLEDRLGRRVESFAYPFGRASGSVKLVDRAGYAAACTTRPGLVTRRARALRLPRLHVGDWPEAELEARLRAALA